jgi:hypothetical protein
MPSVSSRYFKSLETKLFEERILSICLLCLLELISSLFFISFHMVLDKNELQNTEITLRQWDINLYVNYAIIFSQSVLMHLRILKKLPTFEYFWVEITSRNGCRDIVHLLCLLSVSVIWRYFNFHTWMF